MPDPPPNLTQMLSLASAGDRSAAAKLFPLVYNELRELARRYFQQQSPGHTLQPTALVHEAYMKLIDAHSGAHSGGGYNDRTHFLATAATAMRQILVDHARSKRTNKRGGEHQRIALDEALEQIDEPKARRHEGTEARREGRGDNLDHSVPSCLRASVPSPPSSQLDILDVDAALATLADADPRKAQIVELRVFGGLTCAQVATVLDMPVKTAEAHWYAARALLRRELDQYQRRGREN